MQAWLYTTLKMNKPVTEEDSLYEDIEKMSTEEILGAINKEDQKVALSIKSVLPQIKEFVDSAAARMKEGGRLFYIGAGTSGRLGILDASECPPTYGVSPDLVVGLIAGGDQAIRRSVEHAEDDVKQAWIDLNQYGIDQLDTLVGIAASGTTPYVLGGIKDARDNGLLTAGITCNPGSPIGLACQIPVEVGVGPEFITGSTRMKSGTAQKMILNMISTSLMVKLGKVKGNKMVDMQLSNDKLKKRAIRILQQQIGMSEEEARRMLEQYGSVRAVMESGKY